MDKGLKVKIWLAFCFALQRTHSHAMYVCMRENVPSLCILVSCFFYTISVFQVFVLVETVRMYVHTCTYIHA